MVQRDHAGPFKKNPFGSNKSVGECQNHAYYSHEIGPEGLGSPTRQTQPNQNQDTNCMKLLRNSFLALLGLAMAASVQAGPVVSSKGPVIQQSPPAPVGGPYVSIAGGALWLDDASAFGVDLDFDTGFSVLGALGYSFGNGLSVELESGYLGVDSGEASFRGLDFDVEGEFHQVPIFANVLYTVDVTDKVGIYVGGGAGIVWSDSEVDSIDGVSEVLGYDLSDIEGGDEWNFAAQAKAGVSFHLTEAASLNIGYRFFYGHDAIGGLDDSIGHILEGGLTVRF